jgi:hypothetical protein
MRDWGRWEKEVCMCTLEISALSFLALFRVEEKPLFSEKETSLENIDHKLLPLKRMVRYAGRKNILRIREVNCLLSANGMEKASINYLTNKDHIDEL